MLNIVFDLGGVVFTWQPDKIIQAAFESTELQKLVKAEIFDHPDWIALDRGTLEFNHAVERGASRTGLSQTEIQRLLNLVPAALTPIPETMALLQSLSNTSNKLFVLSNMHFASIEHLEQEHSIWNMFAGKVISCRIKKVKPELDIYQHLLNEYALKPEETVFIDDMDVNLLAASTLGIRTIKFINASQCQQSLEKLQCF